MPRTADPPKPGATIEVGYPFVREPFTDPETREETVTWRPGVRPPEPGATWGDADALGTMILTVIDVHKPGPFPARVFFTRRWRDPDGREFERKSAKLLILSVARFTILCRGYRHDFDLPPEPAGELPSPSAASSV